MLTITPDSQCTQARGLEGGAGQRRPLPAWAHVMGGWEKNLQRLPWVRAPGACLEKDVLFSDVKIVPGSVNPRPICRPRRPPLSPENGSLHPECLPLGRQNGPAKRGRCCSAGGGGPQWDPQDLPRVWPPSDQATGSQSPSPIPRTQPHTKLPSCDSARHPRRGSQRVESGQEEKLPRHVHRARTPGWWGRPSQAARPRHRHRHRGSSAPARGPAPALTHRSAHGGSVECGLLHKVPGAASCPVSAPGTG